MGVGGLSTSGSFVQKLNPVLNCRVLRMTNLRSVGTHDGPFHADEVTACALLVVFGLVDEEKIVRTRDPQLLDDCEYVCDVDGLYDPAQKRFDHHQVEYTGPLSSAGMVLLYLKDQGLMDEEEYHHLKDSLVDGVDAHDIGKSPQIRGLCTFSLVIHNFSPIEYDATDVQYHEAFFHAFRFTVGHLERMRARFAAIRAHREEVARAMEGNPKALIFDHKVPWLDNFFALGGEEHPAVFVVMPAADQWKLRGIPPSLEDRMAVRVPQPESWAGLLEDELKEASGIEGAVFCHKGRFISVWETKEDALEAMEKILNGDAL